MTERRAAAFCYHSCQRRLRLSDSSWRTGGLVLSHFGNSQCLMCFMKITECMPQRDAPTFQSIDLDSLPPIGPAGEPAPKLNVYQATAISGNDLIGSCLYTAGQCIATVLFLSSPQLCRHIEAWSFLMRFMYWLAGRRTGPHMSCNRGHHFVRISCNIWRGGQRVTSERWQLQRAAEHDKQAHGRTGCVLVLAVLHSHVSALATGESC